MVPPVVTRFCGVEVGMWFWKPGCVGVGAKNGKGLPQRRGDAEAEWWGLEVEGGGGEVDGAAVGAAGGGGGGKGKRWGFGWGWAFFGEGIDGGTVPAVGAEVGFELAAKDDAGDAGREGLAGFEAGIDVAWRRELVGFDLGGSGIGRMGRGGGGGG